MHKRASTAFARLVVAAFTLLGGLQSSLAQVGQADYYASPNYTVSKLPAASCRDALGQVVLPAVMCFKDSDCTDALVGVGKGYKPPVVVGAQTYPGGATCTGPAAVGTGIRKFVDTLPVLCALGAVDTLGKCLPLAVPDKTTFPGDDYYEIGVKEYATRFHTDLKNPAVQRGFHQINTLDPAVGQNQFLGPIILGQSYRPVRLKFVNELGTGAAGKLKLPVDTTLPGAGDGPDGTPYTENRVAIHLHGGNSPWISDGTQHQWTVPAGETTSVKKGAAVGYVPDMWFDASGKVIPECAKKMACATPGASTNPGEGQLSYYWPNEQSGRLMFYHDHAYGITRLNVMAGVAAGYLLANPTDEDALAAAGVPGTIGSGFFGSAADPAYPATGADLTHLIPLVIQDRTFVPPSAQLAWYDRTWDSAKWGGEDSVWMPHVYTPNQWLANPDGTATNPYGRWDYGPFFWPPQQSLTSLDGQPRPLTVPCLSTAAVTAANPTGATECPSTPNPTLTPESFLDTPVVNGTAYPTMTVDPTRYRFQILNAANDRYWNLSFFVAYTDPEAPQFVNTEVKMVKALPAYLPNIGFTGLGAPPAMCDPYAATPLSQVTGLPVGPDLPAAACTPLRWPSDGRVGGVPDPTMAGPRWVQIGTEAGILPAVAVSAPLPVVYEMNKRNIVVTNIADHSLLLGPAERADVVVDFSQYAGKTLILYSDSPSPVPAGDPRTDYFTWGPDMTGSGGAPSVLPGYGPNTRTIMQVKVNAAGAAAATPLNDGEVARIDAALKARFPVSQLKPIVPQTVFSNMYVPAGAPAGTPPTPITVDTHLPISVQSLTFTPVGAAAPVTMPFQWKALHELFSTDYGRMNSLLAVEIPMTNWLGQTTIPYSNVDPATEFISDNVPALWKITHNGVDTHVIHFHLMNVQIINRVGWDGQIRAPDANEQGWKESVRMNQLEDIYVALQPVKQKLPWPLPDMVRPLDVDRPLGTRSQFTGVDIMGNPVNVTNQLFNFGQEYVWHCHLLGHEENDMLRAEVFVVAPEAPSALTASRQLQPKPGMTLSWQDNSMSAMTFQVQRDTSAAFAGANLKISSAPRPATQPGPVTFVDPNPVVAGTTYYYRVRAEKVLSSIAVPGATWPEASAWTGPATSGVAAIAQLAPASLAFANQVVNTTSGTKKATLTNIGSAVLTVTSVTLTGANAADFVIVSNTCGATVAVGGACDVNIASRPLTTGAKLASLTVVTSSTVAPTQSVALSGFGTAPATPVALLNQATLAFSPQAIAVKSLAKVVTIRNAGSAQLKNIVITATAPFARATGVGNCGTTLNANATCNIYVTFTPPTGGPFTGKLTVASNDPANPSQVVSLTGAGLFPVATSVTVSPLPAASSPAGSSVIFTAVGAGAPVGTVYSYRFWIFDGTTSTLAQDYSVSATFTWAIPLAQNPGAYTIVADVRTNPTATLDATGSVAFTVTPVPAATVVAVAATPATSTPAGSAVTFTAIGSGAPLGAVYNYRFWISNGVTFTLVQDYSLNPSWTWNIPLAQLVGTYFIKVDVRTGPSANIDATATFPYVVTTALASGVTLASAVLGVPATTAAVGTTVDFTAAASGGAPTAVYDYQFTVSDGVTSTIVQPFGSATPLATYSWAIPLTQLPGVYTVTAEAKVVGTAVVVASAPLAFTVTP
jgi:FtsP/CotA-like multicopper oxidase with cupredoxin domain